MTRSRSSGADAHIKRQREKDAPRTEKRWRLDLLIEKDVYPTGQLAGALVQHLEEREAIKEGFVVLDYGCGTGFYAIAAGMLGAAKVVATDISEIAIKCAHKNIATYQQQDRVELRQGDALEPIKGDERFDIIFAGMPWEDAKPTDVYEMSFYDEDFHMRRELFSRAYDLLTPGGYILTTYSGRVEGLNSFETSFCEPYKLHCEIILNIPIYGDPHYVYNVSMAGEAAEDGL